MAGARKEPPCPTWQPSAWHSDKPPATPTPVCNTQAIKQGRTRTYMRPHSLFAHTHTHTHTPHNTHTRSHTPFLHTHTHPPTHTHTQTHTHTHAHTDTHTHTHTHTPAPNGSL